MAAEEVNLEELAANLKEYQEQLAQVEALLLDDPENEEYKGIYESLSEVRQRRAHRGALRGPRALARRPLVRLPAFRSGLACQSLP